MNGRSSPTPEPSQAQLLIQICEEIELFRTPDVEAYADLPVAEHRETWMLRSRGFSRWLSRRFHQVAGKPPRAQALQEAIGLLEAKAQFESPEVPVWVRIAERKLAKLEHFPIYTFRHTA